MRLTKFIPVPFHSMAPNVQMNLITRIREQRKFSKRSTPRKRSISKQVKTNRKIETDVSRMSKEQLLELAKKLEGMV